MQPLVYISIINYNGFEDTQECINSLLKINYINFRIIVVDNKSTDDSLDKLYDKYVNCEKVVVIAATNNAGFSAGNNIVFRRALADNARYVLMLNNDTVVEKDFLTILVEDAESSKNSVISPLILYEAERNKIWYGGGAYDYKTGLSHHFHWNESFEKSKLERIEVSFISGCCCLIPVEAINTVGLMEERYFLYCEDIDYSCRLSRSGFKMVFEPKSVIYHKVSSSTSKISDYATVLSTRNGLVTIDKYVSKNKTWAKFIFILRRLKRIMQHQCKLSAVIKGIAEYLNNSFYN